MLLGLRTIIYPAADLAAATAWFTQVTGKPPYFNQPFYVGFQVGGYELGLLPPGDEDAQSGAVTYWGTDDIAAEYARMLALGAKPQSEPKDVGDGIKVATVFDPAGNVIGLIENPHFKLEGAG